MNFLSENMTRKLSSTHSLRIPSISDCNFNDNLSQIENLNISVNSNVPEWGFQIKVENNSKIHEFSFNNSVDILNNIDNEERSFISLNSSDLIKSVEFPESQFYSPPLMEFDTMNDQKDSQILRENYIKDKFVEHSPNITAVDISPIAITPSNHTQRDNIEWIESNNSISLVNKRGYTLRIDTTQSSLDESVSFKTRKRRRVSDALESTCLHTLFSNRDIIFNEGLNQFYYHFRLSQEGVFYKLHADSFIYGVILFLYLLKNRKEYTSFDESRSIATPVRRFQNFIFPNWEISNLKNEFLSCLLIAMQKLEPIQPQIYTQISNSLDIDICKKEILKEFGDNLPQNTCEIWRILKNDYANLFENPFIKFSIHYIYFEIIIHAIDSDFQSDANPSDIAKAIVSFSLKNLLIANKLMNENIFTENQINLINEAPNLNTIQKLVQMCIERSQQRAFDELKMHDTMALKYRRIINTTWPGAQDFIHQPLEHRHLFRFFIYYRYPQLFSNYFEMNKITGEILHNLGMSVVPEINPTILYFNPESRNYWKEASKSPCKHLESMTKMGKYYLDRQQYDQAYKYINEAAMENYSEALTEMATMYRKGWGPLEPNNEKAVECYKKAIEVDDDGFAHVSLGYMYERGYGIEENLERAFYHYKIASSKGQEYGSAKIGLFYQYGNSVVERDWRESLRWLRLAQHQNYDQAEHHIAELMEMIRAVTLLGNM